MIETIARAGGAMHTSDIIKALPDLSPQQIYDSVAGTARAKHRPKLRRGDHRVYSLTEHGRKRAAELGIFVTASRVGDRRNDVIRAAANRQRRREAARSRRRHFERVWRDEGRVVQPRGVLEWRRRHLQVQLDLPEEFVAELDAELRRRGLQRGRSPLMRLAWRIARDTIMGWPTLRLPGPEPEPEYEPPAVDPPRRPELEPPVFRDLIEDRRASIRETEMRAERDRRVEEACAGALQALADGPAPACKLISAMGVGKTTGFARLKAAVEIGIVDRVGRGVYALPDADADVAAPLRDRIVRALAADTMSIAEVARALGEDRIRVKEAVHRLVRQGRVERVRAGAYRSRPR